MHRIRHWYRKILYTQQVRCRQLKRTSQGRDSDYCTLFFFRDTWFLKLLIPPTARVQLTAQQFDAGHGLRPPNHCAYEVQQVKH